MSLLLALVMVAVSVALWFWVVARPTEGRVFWLVLWALFVGFAAAGSVNVKLHFSASGGDCPAADGGAP